MKKLVLLICSAFLFISVNQAYAESTSVSATTTIIEPIGISVVNNLDFGTIVKPSTAGTVVIGTDDSVSATGGVVAPSSGTSRARLTVTGETSTLVNVTIPSSTTLSNGASTIVVDSFTDDTSSGSLDLTEDGAAMINIGATLNVEATHTSGTYTGTFTVSVDY